MRTLSLESPGDSKNMKKNIEINRDFSYKLARMAEKFSSFQAFRPHFDALARVGYYKNVMKKLSFRNHVLFTIYRVITTSVVVMYNLQHVIKVVEVRQSTEAVVDVLFVLLTTMNTLSKQCAFNLRSRRIDRLIDAINGDLFTASNSAQIKMIKQNATIMSRLLTLYHCAIFTCGAMWAIFPVVNRHLENDVDFTAYFPFETSKSILFELALTYMTILITVQAYGNVTMDCTIVAFYAEGYTQLRILGHNLENLASENIDYGSSSNEWHFDLELQCRFVRCVEHHKLIVWFVKEVDDIFNEAMVLQFLVMALVICMTLYKLVGLDVLSVEFLSMVVYLICMLAQLFIYCYFGTKVKMQSEQVNLSLYSTDWLKFSPKFRRQMLVFMIRASRFLSPTAAYVIPLSLDTYISVLRQAYALFTLLEKSRVK